MEPKADLSIYKVVGAPPTPAIKIPPKRDDGDGIIADEKKKLWGKFKTRNVPEDMSQWDAEDWALKKKYQPESIEGWIAKEQYEEFSNKKKSMEAFAKAGSWAKMSPSDKEHALKTTPEYVKSMLEYEKQLAGLSGSALEQQQTVMKGMGSMGYMLSEWMKGADEASREQIFQQAEQDFTKKFPQSKVLFNYIKQTLTPKTGTLKWHDGNVQQLGTLSGLMINYGQGPKAQEPLSYKEKGIEAYAKRLEAQGKGDEAARLRAGVKEEGSGLSQKEKGIEAIASRFDKAGLSEISDRLRAGETMNQIMEEGFIGDAEGGEEAKVMQTRRGPVSAQEIMQIAYGNQQAGGQGPAQMSAFEQQKQKRTGGGYASLGRLADRTQPQAAPQQQEKPQASPKPKQETQTVQEDDPYKNELSDWRGKTGEKRQESIDEYKGSLVDRKIKAIREKIKNPSFTKKDDANKYVTIKKLLAMYDDKKTPLVQKRRILKAVEELMGNKQE